MNDAARKLPNSLGKARVEIAVQSNTAIPVIVVMQQVMIVKGHPAYLCHVRPSQEAASDHTHKNIGG